VLDRGDEGLVAKNPASPYHGGRDALLPEGERAGVPQPRPARLVRDLREKMRAVGITTMAGGQGHAHARLCEHTQAQRIKNIAKPRQGVEISAAGTIVFKTIRDTEGRSTTLASRFGCLPDIVDPRGRKETQR